MSERKDIETFTSLFRTDTDPFRIRLREVGHERGVDVHLKNDTVSYLDAVSEFNCMLRQYHANANGFRVFLR